MLHAAPIDKTQHFAISVTSGKDPDGSKNAGVTASVVGMHQS
jgi:hypothetical protein